MNRLSSRMTTTNNDRKKKQIVRLKREKYNGIQHSIQIIIDIIYVYTHIWIVYVYIMKKVSVYIP